MNTSNMQAEAGGVGFYLLFAIVKETKNVDCIDPTLFQFEFYCIVSHKCSQHTENVTIFKKFIQE